MGSSTRSLLTARIMTLRAIRQAGVIRRSRACWEVRERRQRGALARTQGQTREGAAGKARGREGRMHASCLHAPLEHLQQPPAPLWPARLKGLADCALPSLERGVGRKVQEAQERLQVGDVGSLGRRRRRACMRARMDDARQRSEGKQGSPAGNASLAPHPPEPPTLQRRHAHTSVPKVPTAHRRPVKRAHLS